MANVKKQLFNTARFQREASTSVLHLLGRERAKILFMPYCAEQIFHA